MSDVATQSRLAVLLFTDVVGSTELKSKLGTPAYARLLSRHNALFEELCAQFNGAEILKHTGDGYFAAFPTASDAVKFALLLQHDMRRQEWGGTPLSTRIGIHIGEVAVVQMAGKPDVVGFAADLAARVMGLAQGGQILITRAAFDDARQFIDLHPFCDEGKADGDHSSAPPLKWLAHGRYQFKGSSEPLEIFEVGAEGHAPLSAPPGGEKAKRLLAQNELPILGWRPALGQAIPNRSGWRLERKLGNASFGEVWLGRHDQRPERRVFKFCFDANRLDSFGDVATLFRVGAQPAQRAGTTESPAAPVFTESDYKGNATALELDLTPSALERIAAPEPDLKQIGPYRMLHVIGEGGMGVVYKAEQRHPVSRVVALKLIKLGMDTKAVLARFESERQALALMNHPNVARVLDAGTSESGRPYFVMEYVPGTPITDSCDRQNYTVRQRLELFAQACDAVQHAHQKALLHRDLKPSNILVMLEDGKPKVKVIDFGVAKATSHKLTDSTMFTEVGQLIGTPEYMSPEQSDMTALDIDTRSDIYSLGMILYELLTGALPFDPKSLRAGGYAELQRIIKEVEPPKPSARITTLGADADKVARHRRLDVSELTRQLRRELEWIPLKAIRKDRSERYGTVAELSADIENYLQNRPLIAAPESAAYRLRKFLKRNKGPVTAVTAVVLAVLIGGLISGLLAIRLKQTADARQEALKAAEAANENAQAVIDFLTNDVIGAANPAVTRGRELTVLQALENASDAVSAQFQNSPVVEGAVHNALAATYSALGKLDSGLRHARVALDLRRRALGPDHADTIVSMGNVASLLRASGRSADAEPFCREALDRARTALGEDHPTTLVFMSNMASLLQEQGRLDQAEPLFREAFERKRRVLGERHAETLNSMNLLAEMLNDADRHEEAERIARDALDKCRSLGPDHPKTLQALRIIGEILMDQQRYADAEPISRDSLARRRNVFGPQHRSTLMEIDNLGWCLQAQGKFDEAETLFQELYQRTPSTGMDPKVAARFMSRLGLMLAQRERFQEADQPLRQAYDRLIASGLHDDARTRDVITALAATSSALGKVEDAARWSALLAPSAKQNR